MKKRIASLIFIALAAFTSVVSTSCEQVDEAYDAQRAVVAQAYIYIDEPVENVHIWQIPPGGSAQRLSIPDAQVRIEQEGHAIVLEADEDAPGTYHQADNSWLPQDGQALTLQARYEGLSFEATAEVPPKLTGLSINNNQIILQLVQPGQVAAELSWDALQGWSYCLFLRNRSPMAQSTGLQPSPDVPNPFKELIHTSSVQLRREHFEYYGIYDLYVTAVHPDYAAMYQLIPGVHEARTPDSFNFGFGIFTVFNGSAVTVTVL